jgi:type IV pilus assembly protein PilO
MELSLTKLPWSAQIGAFVVLGGVAVGAFYQHYEKGARAELSSHQAQLESLRADIAKGLETANKLPEFRAQVDELESRLNNLRAVLPEEKDAGDLLRRLQTVATQSNLQIKSFKPAATVTRQLHAEWPISLELDGTYHNLAVFFDRVGKFTLIVNITGLDIQGKATPEPNANISARCVATTFVLLDQPTLPKLGAVPAARAQSPAPVAPPPERYTYDPSGRRDPFLNLLGSGREPRTPLVRGEGKAGLTVADVSVRGVIQSRGRYIAMVQRPDGTTFLIHQGDKLADGVVKVVNAEGLIVVQDVTDPLSLVKQKEVSKKLRSLEAKP